MTDDLFAVTYDIELFPNVFTLSACQHRRPETMFTWEISKRKDERAALFEWFAYLAGNRVPMIGFNNLAYDYVIIDFLYRNPLATIEDLYALNQKIFASQSRGDRWNNFQIWQDQRFAPQIDLFSIHHFDNVAKSTGLKALQFNMRSRSVQDMPVEHGTWLTDDQIDRLLIPYNRHDVIETDRFAVITAPNIAFRRELSATLTGDVLNFNDTKIGKQMFEQRLGPELCFTRDASGKKQPRQTYRDSVRVADIIFPYIRFQQPEFNRVLDWLKSQTIIETKGVFSDVTASINGFDFHFGTGGIHGSVSSKVYRADEHHSIIDIDVAALYPSIGIVNRLYPAHLGERFIQVWKEIIAERKKHKKGTSQNAALKLAANGPYGDSNNIYSPLYDWQFTMTITINGQLMLCMLAEWLMTVPTLEIIQINTDGITYRVLRILEPMAEAIRKQWEAYTLLVLEEARYKRMFIRDVNNYVGEFDGNKPPKLKGAYVWYDTPEEISNASPSAWHKDLSSPIVQKAAVLAMLHGIDPNTIIEAHTDPFDFMILAKAKGASTLQLGDRPVQKTFRYYIARQGAPLRKLSPPVVGATPGDWKRKTKISDADYYAVLKSIPAGQWDARIHTANKSKYEDRETSVQAGWLIADCCDASKFDWTNLNREWYIEQARKLIIA